MRLVEADALLEALADKFASVNGNIIELITNAPTVEREGWVSVEDRLPKEYEYVLTYTNKNKVEIDKLLKAYGWESTHDIVTHWMPLPAAPKE